MDLELIRGDSDILFKFNLTDKDEKELTLEPTDKLYLTVKKNPNSNDVTFQKRIGNGIELKDDGYYYVMVEPSDTNKLPYGQYGYDLELKTGTGLVKTLLLGSITLTEEYTFEGDEV